MPTLDHTCCFSIFAVPITILVCSFARLPTFSTCQEISASLPEFMARLAPTLLHLAGVPNASITHSTDKARHSASTSGR
jgi:hypothetical protein